MVYFQSDYIAGAHPEVMKRLVETNLECLPGYGADKYCESAKEKIRAAVGREDVQVELLAGGTQTNAVVISTMLSDYEGVIAANTGHINAHESGAVEYTGHKVIGLPHENGKIAAKTLETFVAGFYADENREHMVFPGMVYISHPTEYGTLYSKAELISLSAVCRRYGITLFMDGARLGYGLMSHNTDVTLADIAGLCDVFYIGGTKVGALLAKGRLLGVQFDALFTDGLYFRIGRHAIEKAERMKAAFAKRDYEFFIESYTNQQFVILDDARLRALAEKATFDFWEKCGESRTVVRFATSWSTTDEDIASLELALDELG